MKDRDIAIVILGYNSQEYIGECLDSLQGSSYRNYKIFFVDNNSNDNSVELIKSKYNDVSIITNSKNFGFAKGNNIGIRKAIDCGYNYILILNPDTIVKPDALAVIADHLDPNLILQPLILQYNKGCKTNIVNTTGGILHYLGFSYCGGYNQLSSKVITHLQPAVSSGAGMLIPADLFIKTGGFDDNFFMYHEDVDLCWRARLLGFQVKLLPKSIIWHDYHFSRNKLKYYYTERNRIVFILKNYQTRTIFLMLPFGFITEIGMIFYALAQGWFVQKIKTYFYVIHNLKAIMGQRVKIQRNRLKNDKDLFEYFSAKLSFEEINLPILKIYNQISELNWLTIKLWL